MENNCCVSGFSLDQKLIMDQADFSELNNHIGNIIMCLMTIGYNDPEHEKKFEEEIINRIRTRQIPYVTVL